MLTSLALACAMLQAAPRSLEVYLVDEAGALLVEGWWVRVNQWEGGSLLQRAVGPIDNVSGRASFELTGDIAFVEGFHPSGEATGREEVVLAADATTVHELRFDGPPPVRSLFVQLSGFAAGQPPPEELLATAVAGGRRVRLEQVRYGLYVARGVEPGAYRVEVEDARFVPLVLAEHRTGRSVGAACTWAQRVLVRCVDALDGSPLTAETASVTIRQQGGAWTIHAEPSMLPEAASVRVPPGAELTLEATFDSHPTLLVALAPLRVGEQREVVVQVQRGVTASGRVVSSSGDGVAGVVVRTRLDEDLFGGAPFVFNRVLVTAPGQRVCNSAGVPTDPQLREQILGMAQRMRAQAAPTPELTHRATRTAADGSFQLIGLSAATELVHICLTPWHVSTLRLSPNVPDGAVATLDLAAAASGSVDVVFKSRSAAAVRALQVSLQLGDTPPLGPEAQRAPLTVDGERMPLRGLPLVPCKLSLSSPLSGRTHTVEFVPAGAATLEVTVDLDALRL